MNYSPGDRLQLPHAPPARKNAKPKQRWATVRKPPFEWTGHVFVEKSDRVGYWWVKESVIKEIEGWELPTE